MKHLVLIPIVVLSLMTMSCSLLPKMASLVTGAADKGISVDAQIGDRENALQAGGASGAGIIEAKDNAHVEVTTSNGETSFETAKNVLVQNTPPWLVALLILGWVLPTPTSIFRGARNKWQAITRRRRSLKDLELKPK